MERLERSLEFLKEKIGKEEKMQIWSFQDYLQEAIQNPQKFFRDIFTLFSDAVMYYVGEGKSEYPMDDPANAPLIVYDCFKLFEEDLAHPYFVDRFFANRIVEEVKSLARGAQQNRILAFIGPYGCGKSIFLNDLLEKFERYLNKKEVFEVFWEIDPTEFSQEGEKFEVPCPSHDYPLFVLPKQYRREFLELLLPDSPEKSQIFNQKEYQWIFHRQACSICNSLFWATYERVADIEKVLKMIKVRSYRFDRRLGEGIVVFNPGDLDPLPPKRPYFTHERLQEKLDKVFGPNRVRYMYSVLAKSNNGIYVLMDIKDHNIARFKALHNVVSEGVWRAGEIEEKIDSLFLALMNPEDKDNLEKEEIMKSLRGRIRYIDISYALDPKVEVKVYESTFGKEIHSHFLPRVLENFAKVIVSTRMKEDCPPLKGWIKDWATSIFTWKYQKYCDKAGKLLRMDIYSGKLPLWLFDEDRRRLDLPQKREILLFPVKEGVPVKEREGMGGFDGRTSIQLFENFFNLYRSGWKLIRMDNVADYFREKIDTQFRSKITSDFIDGVVNYYDYEAVSELKEALYFYDEKQIAQDILHFIWASAHKIGEKVTCPWTKKEFEVTQGFLRETAIRLTGKSFLSDIELKNYVLDIQNKFSVATMQGDTREITKSELYQYLLQNYIKNLKEKVLEPFIDNRNFLAAIHAYGTKEFEAFESRIKDQIKQMIGKLMEKFGYTMEGAKELAIYVLERKIPKKFS